MIFHGPAHVDAATIRPLYENNTYNAFNQLRLTRNNRYETDYQYRPDGLRFQKTTRRRGQTASHMTYHAWDGAQIALETNGHGTVTNRFYRGLTLIRSDHHGWYLHNARGDVIHLTNDRGQITHTYQYSAFGLERDKCDRDTNPFRFNGEYYDFETGNQYLRFRNYDPHKGRFTQEDPIRWGHNWYCFAIQNPIMFVDPWGLAPQWVESNDVYLLRDQVEAAGGSIVWCSTTYTARTTVFGVTVDFTQGNDGVWIDANGRMQVDSNVFYSTILAEAGEMAFVGSHEVHFGGRNTGARHAGIVIFASPDSPFYNYDIFANNYIFGNNRFATLGAGPMTEDLREVVSGTLVASPNHSRDVGIVRDTMQGTNMVMLNATATQMGNLIEMDAYFRSYTSVLNYSARPIRSGSFNSNSYIYSLLVHAGITPPHMPTTWGGNQGYVGWGRLIPHHFFVHNPTIIVGGRHPL